VRDFISINVEHGGENVSTTKAPTPKKVYPAELKAILEQAMHGDASVLPALRRAFEEHPELPEQFGDLVEIAKINLLNLATGSNLLVREALTRTTAALKERLAATANSELERLLIDRIVLSWIEVYHGDSDLATRLLKSPGGDAATRDCQKRLDRAHARYLSAVKALATVQKLLKPSPSAFDLLRKPVAEAPDPWAARGKSTQVPACN
jgi:hypothetical protein